MLKSKNRPLTTMRLKSNPQPCNRPWLRTALVTMPMAVTLIVTLVSLSGCNTPQQKAQNSPPPIPPQAQPTPQPNAENAASPETSGAEQQGSQQAQQGDTAAQPPASQSGDPSPQAATEQAKAPPATCEESPVASSPDVEITEVPLDKYGNPIEPEPATIADSKRPQDECKTAKTSTEQQETQQQTEAQKQAQAQRATNGGMTQKAQTGEEKLAAANASLDARLAAFDEAMRRAREAAEQQRQGAAGNQSGGLGGEFAGRGGNPNMPAGARGEGGQADTASGLGRTPDQSGETNPGNYKRVANGPVPANIPDGRDDDIVARQLREAASKESDPVLRNKLWEEYKKYKTGITGR